MMTLQKRLLAVFIVLLLCVTGATAAGTGTLTTSGVTDVALGENGTVMFTLPNDFAPKVGGLTYRVYYDNTVATAVEIETHVGGGVSPVVLTSPITFTLATTTGVPNGNPGLFDIIFTSQKNDGSATDIGVVVVTAKDTMLPPTDLKGSITVINGTFTTKDEVAPVLTITTSNNVGKNFKITGTITEVGGMGTATATLTKGASTKPYSLDLTDLGNGAYTYTVDASWAVFEDGVVLTVNAVDAAGNVAAHVQNTINVKNVGFSNPSPIGPINSVPTQASAFMSQINTTLPVTMTLGGAVGPIVLPVAFDAGYAIGTFAAYGDGTYWVNVTGTDDIGGEEHFLNWTYVLDTSVPTLAVTIADSDGDGYIEANEALNFTWTATAPGASGFKNVTIVDTKTTPAQVLWSNSNSDGTDVVTFPTGNRDLSFRAYTNAGNYVAQDFHLYNNYVVWVNSTKIGTISGLDTQYTAMVEMDRTATSTITLLNGRSVSAPTMGTVTRQVASVGQVTPDTFVAVDVNADATYAGTATYQSIQVYEPTQIVDFNVIAPAMPHANIVMMEANQSYINQIIDSGTAGIDYGQLLKKSAYIFINGGWAKVTINNDGTFSQVNYGAALTVGASDTVSDMLKRPQNQVDISSGYRMSIDSSVPFNATTTPPVGEYVLTALSFDADRIGVIAMMPVVVLETAGQGTLSLTNVPLGGSFVATAPSSCKYFGVALYRNIQYDATATIDFSKLNNDVLSLNLTTGGVAATEKLLPNIYITPGTGKYATATNTNTLTFDVSGLQAGNYKAMLTGLSTSGNVQLLGVHDVTIGAAPTPTPYNPGGGGGGGRSVTPAQEFTSAGLLQSGADGITTNAVIVSATDGLSSISIGKGVKALDANGNPIDSITINSIGNVPAPGSSTFSFAGHAVEMGPAGATFSPATQLTFKLTEEEWNKLEAGETFAIKWYNDASGEWEAISTSVNPNTRTVTGQVSHFSTFALFKQIVETPTTPPVTQTTAPAETPVPGDTTTGGFPWVWVVVAIVLIALIGGGYYYMQQQKK